MHSQNTEVAKAGHSYRLRTALARSDQPPIAARSTTAGPGKSQETTKIGSSGMCRERRALYLRPRPLVADAEQLHRPVRDRDPERGPDGARDQMDVAAMGAQQFGGDRQA